MVLSATYFQYNQKVDLIVMIFCFPSGFLLLLLLCPRSSCKPSFRPTIRITKVFSSNSRSDFGGGQEEFTFRWGRGRGKVSSHVMVSNHLTCYFLSCWIQRNHLPLHFLLQSICLSYDAWLPASWLAVVVYVYLFILKYFLFAYFIELVKEQQFDCNAIVPSTKISLKGSSNLVKNIPLILANVM